MVDFLREFLYRFSRYSSNGRLVSHTKEGFGHLVLFFFFFWFSFIW